MNKHPDKVVNFFSANKKQLSILWQKVADWIYSPENYSPVHFPVPYKAILLKMRTNLTVNFEYIKFFEIILITYIKKMKVNKLKIITINQLKWWTKKELVKFKFSVKATIMK